MKISFAAPETAPSMPVTVPDAVWITWETQRRNPGIASAMGVPLFAFDIKGSRLKRYVVSLWRTARVIVSRRPAFIFVQNPSVVLALATVTAGPWLGATVIVDAHNAAIIPLYDAASWWMRRVARYIVRRASLTLITNEALSKIVTAAGGRAFILPDRIPELPPPGGRAGRLAARTVLFICSFASDEPYMEVIEAARAIDPSVRIYVTGNPRHRAAALKAISPPNVVFTGFVPEDEYVEMLHSADVIIDLTSREDCLVCGAYEGVAAERPLILSGTAALRSHFSQGVRFTDNTRADLAAAIHEALAARDQMQHDIRRLKTTLTEDWNRRRAALVTQLAGSRID